MLGFTLRKLRYHGRSEKKNAGSTKRSAVWTVSSTSQATDSSPEDYNVEEEDVTEAEFEESLEQEENSSDKDKGFTLSCDDVTMSLTCFNSY